MVFDLTTSQDFYHMLISDFDDFMLEPNSARKALHCAITAYHLHEWVWGDWLKTDYAVQKTMGIRDRNTFIEWIERAAPWFATIQELANGTKHFIRDQSFEAKKIQGYGRGPFSVGPYGTSYLLIDYGAGAGEHQFVPAAHLLEVIVRFWRDFFKIHRPNFDLTVNKHHID